MIPVLGSALSSILNTGAKDTIEVPTIKVGFGSNDAVQSRQDTSTERGMQHG